METSLFHPLVDETFNDLTDVISNFQTGLFNVVPFQGSWTAGQLCQHIVLSNRGFLQLIKGNVKPADRDPYQMVETIRRDFLDFSTKATSPPAVDPKMKEYDKNAILDHLQKIFADLSSCLNTLDLTQICTMFELPMYGYLSRIEAVSFMVYHTKRHTFQLKQIAEKLI